MLHAAQLLLCHSFEVQSHDDGLVVRVVLDTLAPMK